MLIYLLTVYDSRASLKFLCVCVGGVHLSLFCSYGQVLWTINVIFYVSFPGILGPLVPFHTEPVKP